MQGIYLSEIFIVEGAEYTVINIRITSKDNTVLTFKTVADNLIPIKLCLVLEQCKLN